MFLKRLIVLVIFVFSFVNAEEIIKKNCFLANLYLTTKGFESENSDLLHWYISYERNITHSFYSTIGFSFYRTPKGTLSFKQDGKQWDIPLQVGLVMGKGQHRFNSSIGVDLSFYKLTKAPLKMVGLSEKGFEVHPTLTTSWRIYPKLTPFYSDIGTKIVVDYHGGIPLSIGIGGGVGCIY